MMVAAVLGDCMMMTIDMAFLDRSRARRDFEGGRLREGPYSLSERQGFGTRNRYQEPV